MPFSTRKILIGTEVIASIVLWSIEAPKLLHWVNAGMLTLLSLLLLLAAVIAMLVGGLQVLLGKRGRTAFILHLAFAVLALVAMDFLFALPYAVGFLAAITALAWPFVVPQGTQADRASSDGSAA